jgi:hypothetical protein
VAIDIRPEVLIHRTRPDVASFMFNPMTISEYERRILDRIETSCRTEDPGFADRMDMTAAQERSSRVGRWPRAATRE